MQNFFCLIVYLFLLRNHKKFFLNKIIIDDIMRDSQWTFLVELLSWGGWKKIKTLNVNTTPLRSYIYSWETEKRLKI